MSDVTKGSKTVLTGKRHVVEVVTSADLADTVDVTAVLLGSDGKVRSDNDLVFYNSPRQPGVELTSTAPIAVDLSLVPHDIHRVLIAGSTEAQGMRFADVHNLVVAVRSEQQQSVLQMVAFYRRGGEWKLDAIGQGYDQGLAASATDHGIEVETDGTDTASDPTSSPPAAQSAEPAAVNLRRSRSS